MCCSPWDHRVRHDRGAELNELNSDYNRMKSEVSNRRKTGKVTELWKLNKTLLNNGWIKYIIREIRKHLQPNEIEKRGRVDFGFSRGAVKKPCILTHHCPSYFFFSLYFIKSLGKPHGTPHTTCPTSSTVSTVLAIGKSAF